MSKIVIDARELRTTTGRYVERLLNYLQEVDNNNDYIILLKEKDIGTWSPKNKKFNTVICPHQEFTFKEQVGLLKQINGIKPDLVHFTMVQQPVVYLGKVVTTMHDLTTVRFRNPSKNWIIFTLKQFVYILVNVIVANKSKEIITPSKFVKEDIVKFSRINKSKVNVTYEAADEIKNSAEPIDNLFGEKFLLYVGRPTPHKNLKRLILSFDIAKKQDKDLKLVLAGKLDSNYLALKDLVKSKKIEGVYFTDFIKDSELKWLYQNCVAYVFPSLSEGFGLPGLEAMVHGAPVISSNATCLPEIYGDAAEYFNPENVIEMASAISKVVANEKLREDLIKKGFSQAEKYSWKRMAEQTLEIYQKALKN